MRELLFGLLLLTSFPSFGATTIKMEVTFLIEGEGVSNVTIIGGRQMIEGVFCGVRSQLDTEGSALDFRKEVSVDAGIRYGEGIFFCAYRNQ